MTIKSKVGEDKKLFGSVNAASLQHALDENGISIEKKYITINGTNLIKTIGSFSAKVRLHRDLIADLSFEVIAA